MLACTYLPGFCIVEEDWGLTYSLGCWLWCRAEVVHANRSAALHALGQLKAALAAGLEATAIAPRYAKGHLRVANGEPNA